MAVFNPMRPRQQGAVLVLVALSIAVLIGFVGLVIDVGHLFVIKTELQSANDACALAASAELRPGLNVAGVLDRAVSAGLTAGNRNKVDFQGGPAGIASTDIYFSDRLSNNSTTFPFGYVPYSGAAGMENTAKYVMCAHSKGGVNSWFMQVLLSSLGQTSTPSTVAALATATQKSAQISCAIPMGVCKLPAGTAANPTQGMVVGQWLTSKLNQSATGSFDWIDFTPPSGGASELAATIKGQGQCSLPSSGTQVGEQGNITSLGAAWNTRFGLYKGANNVANAPPDFTGYAYNPTTWPTKFDAYGGTSATGIPNFKAARASNLPYQGDAAAGISMQGGYQNTSQSTLQSQGADRRLVTVPVVDCSSWIASNPQTVPVLGYACVLLLHPMSKDNGPSGAEEVWMEFRGASNDIASPCVTYGLAGGTAGPLVPVLVH